MIKEKQKTTDSAECPFCRGTDLRKKWTKPVNGQIVICNSCGLGFDGRSRKVRYETDETLMLDPKKMNQYYRYTERIAAILNRKIEQYVLFPNTRPLDVLEIGSGYGFLSDCITRKLNVENYYNYEINRDLQNWLRGKGKKVINGLDGIGPVDVIILSHVLEHIADAKVFLSDLLKNKLRPHGYIILLQTDHTGFIPGLLPFLWYGWQLQQHYYHFTPRVFSRMCENEKICSVKFIEKYYLDQDFSFSLKGAVKAFLKILNSIIPQRRYDAFMICIAKEQHE